MLGENSGFIKVAFVLIASLKKSKLNLLYLKIFFLQKMFIKVIIFRTFFYQITILEANLHFSLILFNFFYNRKLKYFIYIICD